MDFVEDIWIPDDGITIRAAGIRGFEEPPARAPSRVILIHVHLAQDDLLFFLHLSGRQRRVLHDIAKDINCDLGAGVRDVDVIDRAVERRVGVHVSARVLNFLIDAAGFPRGCSLKEHMLQHMRHARAQPSAFIDAAGFAPGLSGDDGGTVIFADDQRQSIFESD